MAHRIHSIRFDLGRLDSHRQATQTRGFAIAPSGALAMVHGSAAIRQAIGILLSTHPGERVMRPQYGCPLHTLTFEPNDAATAGLAAHYIREALTLWEPRIRIVSLAADNDAHAERDVLTIHLQYEIIFSGEPDSLSIDIKLNGRDGDAISDTPA